MWSPLGLLLPFAAFPAAKSVTAGGASMLALRNLVAMLDVQPYAAVMDQGQFHGLITRADVLNYLRRQMTVAAAH